MSRHSHNNMANSVARRRIIVASDKPPTYKMPDKSSGGSKMQDYSSNENKVSHHYKQQHMNQVMGAPNPKKFVKDYLLKPIHRS